MSDTFDKPRTALLSAPTSEGVADTADRREGLRFPFTIAADVTELPSQIRVAGRTSDIGLGGCYVDTLTPLSVGAVVRLRLERELRQVDAVAKVVFAHPSMGMGLRFCEVNPAHEAILQSWVTEASGDRAREPGAPGPGPEGMVSAILNLREVLNELINLMVRNRMVDDKQVAPLLRRIFH